MTFAPRLLKTYWNIPGRQIGCHKRRNFVLDNESSPFYNGSVNRDRLNTEMDGLNALTLLIRRQSML